MPWRQLRIPEPKKSLSINSDRGTPGTPRSFSYSFSNNVSSQTSTFSAEHTQPRASFTPPKWAVAVKQVTVRLLDLGEIVMQSLRDSKANSRRGSDTSSEQQDDNTSTEFSTVANSLGRPVYKRKERQPSSPVPTWTTTDDLAHYCKRYEKEDKVIVFSGWAAFCGTYATPPLVSRTHWDDRVAHNKQTCIDSRTPPITLVERACPEPGYRDRVITE